MTNEAKRILGDAVCLWEEELTTGLDGQDRYATGTWMMNPLYRAVCCEASARDCEKMGAEDAAEAWREKGIAYLTEGI